jgi:hypothetical protein
MANTFKSTFQTLGTTGSTVLYTTPATTTTILKSLYVANVGGSTTGTINVTVGFSGSTTAHLIKNGSVPYATTLQVITEPVVMETTERISVQASAANLLDVTLSYLEIT